MKFLVAIIVLSVLISLAVAAAGLAVSVWADNIDELELMFPRLKKDPLDYRRGYEQGRLYALKYPMGQLTFPIACSHCKNVGSDKCCRCKEERESGFELKTKEESL